MTVEQQRASDPPAAAGEVGEELRATGEVKIGSESEAVGGKRGGVRLPDLDGQPGVAQTAAQIRLQVGLLTRRLDRMRLRVEAHQRAGERHQVIAALSNRVSDLLFARRYRSGSTLGLRHAARIVAKRG